MKFFLELLFKYNTTIHRHYFIIQIVRITSEYFLFSRSIETWLLNIAEKTFKNMNYNLICIPTKCLHLIISPFKVQISNYFLKYTINHKIIMETTKFWTQIELYFLIFLWSDSVNLFDMFFKF